MTMMTNDSNDEEYDGFLTLCPHADLKKRTQLSYMGTEEQWQQQDRIRRINHTPSVFVLPDFAAFSTLSLHSTAAFARVIIASCSWIHVCN
mmetsp:Transcript_16067/g.30349  ORF Transcript_16067/g.30349 Transcript_16067/m.30349 type:complete len:91 (+) Transcript_16067:2890-3162(+)